MQAEGFETMAASEMLERNSQARPHRPKRRHHLLRPVFDALGAGLLFVVLTAVCASAPVKACPFSGAFGGIERSIAPQSIKAVAEPGPAPIIEIATTSSVWDPNAVFRRTSGTAAWGLLGLSLSLLAALNLSFFRHLRRVYASPQARHQDVK
jgi:hypothetical protein